MPRGRRRATTILVGLRALQGDAARRRKVDKRFEAERDAIESASAERRADRAKTERVEANWVSADELRAAVREREEQMGSMLSDDAPGVTALCAGNSPLEAFVAIALAEKCTSRLNLATVLIAKDGKATDPEITCNAGTWRVGTFRRRVQRWHVARGRLTRSLRLPPSLASPSLLQHRQEQSHHE